MSQQRKIQRAALRRLFGHSYMTVEVRRGKTVRYAWAVRSAKDNKIVLGPRGNFRDEEDAWQAGWQEVMRRAEDA